MRHLALCLGLRCGSLLGRQHCTSLDLVEPIMSPEDEFEIETSDGDGESLRTVGDVVALLRAKLN